MKRLIVLAVAVFALASCATQYGAQGLLGGKPEKFDVNIIDFMKDELMTPDNHFSYEKASILSKKYWENKELNLYRETRWEFHPTKFKIINKLNKL